MHPISYRFYWLLLIPLTIVNLFAHQFTHTALGIKLGVRRLEEQTTTSAAPLVLYTDIISGPTTGGENNKGIYLSIFGKNFGSTGLGTAVKVYINQVEVDNYRYLGPCKGRTDIQQITVQIGAIGNPTPGVALPLQVVVNGVASNSDQTFMVNPGRILFVDPVNGNDTTAMIGEITKPFKTVQTPDLLGGAWGVAQPGDFLVLRGGTYTSMGSEQYFIRFWKADKTAGTPPTGQAKSGPYTLMSYPTEDAFINADSTTHPMGAISGLNGISYPKAGKWVVIANLRVEGGGYDGPISQQIYGDNWRIVNNELTAYTGVTSGPSPSRMAGITGNGKNAVWLGNHIHDIQGSPQEAHGIYIDGNGSYNIGYNLIHDIKSGNGFLTYANGTNGAEIITNVKFHHNIIHDVSKHLINLADGTASGIQLWNNLGYNAQFAAIRFNTITLVGAKIWNNTFYRSNRATVAPDSHYGALTNDWQLPPNALNIKNNIFVPMSGAFYVGGTVTFSDTIPGISNNLWFGGDIKDANHDYSFDKAAITGDPRFVQPGIDFHLQADSAAVDRGTSGVAPLVTNDLDLITTRPQGAGMDVGAYEAVATITVTPTPTPTSTSTLTATPTPAQTPTLTPVATPLVDCTLSINRGALFTKETQVTLTLNAANVTHMIISNDGGFSSVTWQSYQPTVNWNLRPVGSRIATLTVYARFRGANNSARCGGASVSDDIIYDALAPTVSAILLSDLQRADMPTQRYQLALFAADQPEGSGVAAMQVSTQSDFTDAVWQPFATNTAIEAAPETVLYVRVRDGAGNESPTVAATVPRPTLYLPLILQLQ